MLSFLSLLTSAQDYQLFNADTKKVYKTIDDLAETFNLVFDSVIIQGSDIVYYPYKSLGDSGYFSDTCYMWNDDCYFMDSPTWMGSHISKSEDAYTFNTVHGQILNFDFNLSPLQAHIFFEDNAQRFSISRVSPGIDTMNVLGIIDSVVRYQIAHTDLQGNFINSQLNTWQIIIGKQFGLINFFRVDVFPLALVPLTLLGNENPDGGIYNVTNALIYNYYPGNVIQYHDTYYDPLSPHLNTEEYRTETFIERVDTGDSLMYKIVRERYIPDSSQLTFATVWLKYNKNDVIATIPYDRIESDILYSSGLYKDDYCGLNLWTYYHGDGEKYVMYCPEENSWCGFDAFGYTSIDMTYVEGLGLYYYHSGTPGPFTNSSRRVEINYFNKNGVECGELVVGISDAVFTNSALSISPNPAQEFFIIQGKVTCSDMIVYQQDGSRVLEVEKYNSGEKIDISHLSPGCYMIRITDGNSIRNGKLIKL